MPIISIRLNEEEERQLNERVSQSNLNRNQYLKMAMLGNTVSVVNKSKDIYQGLIRINECVLQLERKHKGMDFDSIREEVFNVCQMLNS